MTNITKKSMIKLEIEIIGYRIIIRHIANTQSVINVTRTDLLYGVLSLSIIFGGKMDNKFKRIIEHKKQKGSIRKPKYATRKLSIGLVSCMLGYALLVSPSSVEAAELDSENQAVAEETAETETTSEENLVEENKEASVEESVEEETPASTEAPKETEKTEEAPEATDEAPVEEKEAFTLTDAQKKNLKEAGFTDEEVAEIEEEIAGELEKDPKFDTDSFLKEITEQKAAELEKSEEAKAEPVAAGEKKITNIQGTIDGNTQSNVTTVKPLASDTGEGYDSILKTAFSFDVPDSITGGDTFEVKVSDNVNLHGISQDSVIDDLYYNGELLAKAEVQPDGRTIIYRFTDYVDKIANIKMNISFPLFIDKVNVPENSEKEKVVVSVDGYEISKTVAVDYSRDGYYKDEKVETLSGKANLDTVTDTSYHHTIYVNTNNQELTNSQLRIRNQDGTDGAIFDQGVLDSVKVYRLNDGSQLKGSFNLDYADLTDVTDKATIRKALDEKMGILVDINQTNDKASYVVVYDGKRKEKTSLNTIVEFGATRKKRIDGTPEGNVPIADRNWSWKNDVHFDDGDGSATGDEKPKVYKLGDTVWYDDNGNGIQDEDEKPAANVYVTINVDGKKTSLRTDKDGKYVFNNLPNGEYELTFSHFDGYKITTPNAGDNDKLDSDGVLIDGVVTAKGTINGADNMSVDLGLVAIPGSFQEHHVYITKDEDGNVIDKETITEDGEVKEGTKDQTYPTGKKDKEGYKFVRTENAVNEPTYNENGEAAEGNFKPGVKQEITYVYEKTESEWTPIEETGKFQEHHIYITKDKDGKEIKREVVDGKVTGGTKDMTYTTGKAEKDGFKFVRTENPVEEPSYSEQGEKTTGNYKPGVTQEITYVYEKTETPWTPLEPVEPGTPGETPDIPWTPLEPSEPVEPETPDMPWLPLEPSEPVEPEKPETPDKPEKPGKPETPEDNKDNKVQVPVVESKKEAKKETPTRKKGNPKTGVGSISGAALGLIAAASGLFVSKKNKDEE